MVFSFPSVSHLLCVGICPKNRCYLPGVQFLIDLLLLPNAVALLCTAIIQGCPRTSNKLRKPEVSRIPAPSYPRVHIIFCMKWSIYFLRRPAYPSGTRNENAEQCEQLSSALFELFKPDLNVHIWLQFIVFEFEGLSL